ncbi:MAG: GH3 [uncultured Corynebacteriales bacterium]|uniref:GH3 n=1 Tax=uncultured Mycobacteriales bacterium TaxID=581187 RepID=A0A6J4IPG7_9ACTN|nr:MAG: GH3 [uncultured Corynebacteriales bacterium]
MRLSLSTRRAVLAATLVAVTSAGLPAAPGSAAPAAAPTAGQPVVGPLAPDSTGCARIPDRLPTLADWPTVLDNVPTDAVLEARIRSIVGGMTLAEKIGQMTQPEITSITPAEVRQHHIGSILNGGGAWPNADKRASPQDWLRLADAYWQASMESNAGTKIPVIWGIDAVHGNNNVYGATLFPHNIGLGAAHDPCLVRDIGAATATQMRATGQDWAFAPTLAVVRDDRWGRTYEGYSEDPRITRAYGFEATKGLQGGLRPGTRGVIATAKHFIGDGGTERGVDQGVNAATEAELINVHGQGYYGSLAAGAQTVMVSFNSWTNEAAGIAEGKLHGSRYALTDVLKRKMAFDGVVVSDWNGIGQVPGCTNSRCARAINAGIDVVMVPADWRAFITETTALVESGEIPMSRIDDAVSRILRVKFRSGVFGQPKPSLRRHAGEAAALQAWQLARRAVRESLVLLKNDGNVLPLKPTARVLVVGKSADSMSNQTGGWSLTWQGTGNTNADFPTGTTVLGGLREALGDADVTFAATGEGVDPAGYDAVVAVIGETPYAEGVGDIGRRTLTNATLRPDDLAVLNRVTGRGAPVVTVLVSGRPLHVNAELNRSQAFVAAWLPGTEGGGVADLLVRGPYTGTGFTGRLSYSWPRSACQTPLNAGDAGYDPLFRLGHGLRYTDRVTLGPLDESVPAGGCSTGGGGGTATEDREVFNRGDVPPYAAYIGSPDNWGGTPVGNDPSQVVSHTNISVSTSDVNVQQDARRVTWTGTGPGQFYLQEPGTGSDLRGYLNATGALVFDTIVHSPPAGTVVLRADCVYPCIGELPGTSLFRSLPVGTRTTVKVPLSCFDAAGLDFSTVNTPMVLFTEGAFSLSVANVRWSPGAGDDPDAVRCADLS